MSLVQHSAQHQRPPALTAVPASAVPGSCWIPGSTFGGGPCGGVPMSTWQPAGPLMAEPGSIHMDLSAHSKRMSMPVAMPPLSVIPASAAVPESTASVPSSGWVPTSGWVPESTASSQPSSMFQWNSEAELSD